MAGSPRHAGLSLVPSRGRAPVPASLSPGAAAARAVCPARAAHPAGAAAAPLCQHFPPLSVLLSRCKTHIFIFTCSKKALGATFGWFLSQLDALVSKGRREKPAAPSYSPEVRGCPHPTEAQQNSTFSL